MKDPEKKVNRKENVKDEKDVEEVLTDSEAEAVAGGTNFKKVDREASFKR